MYMAIYNITLTLCNTQHVQVYACSRKIDTANMYVHGNATFSHRKVFNFVENTYRTFILNEKKYTGIIFQAVHTMLPVSRSVALVVAGVLSVAHLTIAFAVGFGKEEPLFYQQVI